jgi:hypothetical protein
MSNPLDGHAMAKALGSCEERASARKKKQRHQRRSEELVNSNSKKFPLK